MPWELSTRVKKYNSIIALPLPFTVMWQLWAICYYTFVPYTYTLVVGQSEVLLVADKELLVWHYTQHALQASVFYLHYVKWNAFSALTLLVGRQEERPACKNQQWGAGVVICLERDAGMHMAQLMPLPLTISCFSKIQIGFTFLVPAHPGSPVKKGR